MISLQTIQTWDFLNQTYTLYGRNSMLYRGVSISTATSDKELCSTITYKQVRVNYICRVMI